MNKEQILRLVSQLTLEEKAGLTSGKDNWFTKSVERMGIPSVRTSDGPHGLRTQVGEINSLSEASSATAICYPSACATAASFDRDLLRAMGEELGRECQAYGVNVLLGPGVNMKRSPLCGRNFEYFSEDPYLAGELGAAYVNGVQSEGVGTSLKHFFANSQETRRMDVSSEMDERTMREIYLPAFEKVVKKAQPWTVMASYNKIGGVFSTQNKIGLTDILRNEWGFEGAVTSDWGATHDRAAAVQAGCDLTMPAENTDNLIVEAVQNGKLAEADLDLCCVRLLDLAFKSAENHRDGVEFDFEGGHALAKKIAAESAVLLKNENRVLPLSKGAKVAFIGGFAETPRYQGGGSSHITSFKVTGALEAAQAAGVSVTYAPGYDENAATNIELLSAAVETAKSADAAVVFIGLTDAMESEGLDRLHMNLSDGHNALVEAVAAANSNTVVVLHNGSPVELPWLEKVPALLEVYLGGEAVGEATADILFGNVNPSGHLAESFPKRLEDNPSYLSYFGSGPKVLYQEGVFIGYRYYESKKIPVNFPFGHGLSYTSFAYSDLTLDKAEIDEGEAATASVTVTNTGERAGKAVVQLYIAPEKVEMIRPVRELKDFSKVELQPGESKRVTFVLDQRTFAYWNDQVHAWRTENGGFKVQICENAHDVVLEAALTIHAEPIPPVDGYSLAMPMSDFVKSKRGHAFIDQNIGHMVRGMAAMGFIPKEGMDMLEQIPGGITLSVINMMAERAGGAFAATGGVNTLLSQNLSLLYGFLPEENKAELNALINELNG